MRGRHPPFTPYCRLSIHAGCVKKPIRQLVPHSLHSTRSLSVIAPASPKSTAKILNLPHLRLSWCPLRVYARFHPKPLPVEKRRRGSLLANKRQSSRHNRFRPMRRQGFGLRIFPQGLLPLTTRQLGRDIPDQAIGAGMIPPKMPGISVPFHGEASFLTRSLKN